MSNHFAISKFKEPALRQEMRQECPKCKKGYFEKSDNVEILLVCPVCDHTIWLDPQKNTNEKIFNSKFLEECLENNFDENFIAYDSDHYIWSFKGNHHYIIRDISFVNAHSDKGHRALFLEGCNEGNVEKIN